MGVLSVEELLLVLSLLPLASGVELFLGEELPKPTGVLSEETRPPPDLMLEERRTEEPRGLSESELRETLEPAREGPREPPLRAVMAEERREVKPIVWSS